MTVPVLTAVFSASSLGGSELFNLEFLATASAQGTPVRAIVPGAGPLLGALDGITSDICVVPIPDELTSMSRFEPGVELQRVPARAMALARYSRRLRQVISECPGPLCAMGFRSQLALAVAAPRRRRVVWVVHEVVPGGVPARLWRRAARRAEPILTYSRAAARQPALVGRRASVLAVRFDLGSYAQQPRPATPPRVIGLVGDLVELKNHLFLVDVVDRLRARGYSVTGLLVGRDVSTAVPRTAGYAAAVRQAARARPGVIELTAASPEDMPGVMSRVDLLVHASLVPESFGRVCVEAMASGRPVVAFDHGAVAELVEHERTGILCQAGDADAVVAAIAKTIDDPEFYERLAGTAKEQSLARYSDSAGARDTIGDALADLMRHP